MPVALVELLEAPLAINLTALRPFLSWVEQGWIPASALRDVAVAPARGPRTSAGARIIQVAGPITRYPTPLSFLCGGASTEEIRAQLDDALADPGTSRIVMLFDSPGGTIDGIPELADAIFSARKQKDIVALVDTTAASAAYWLASQASQIVVTPSSRVGSIGVFAVHVDQSKALELLGVKPTFVVSSNAPRKVEENSTGPLSDDARAEIQARVDAFESMFIRDVARGRDVAVDVVRKEFGQGRVVLAKDAVARGMADRIGTLDQVMSERGQRIATAAALHAARGQMLDLALALADS